MRGTGMLGSYLLACARVSRLKGGLGQTGNCRNDGTAKSQFFRHPWQTSSEGLHVSNTMEKTIFPGP